MTLLAQYGLFVAKTFTFVIAILLLSGGLLALLSRGKMKTKEQLEIKMLNNKYNEMANQINTQILTKLELKQLSKQHKKIAKERKQSPISTRKRIFVLRFDGDIKASAVNSLREEISAILTVATPADEVIVCLESGGGLVHSYGLAASHLQRIKEHNIPLVIAVDKVAASGGYMMACVADRLLAAPFAIIGSIGVLAQVPNFNRLLKKHNIDFEQLSAGEFKRTVTLFGENTVKGRHKFQQELEDVHHLFKDFISRHRAQVDIDQVATGEHWLAIRAIEMKLVDELITSDDYLLKASQQADLYQVAYRFPKTFSDKVFAVLQLGVSFFSKSNKFL